MLSNFTRTTGPIAYEADADAPVKIFLKLRDSYRGGGGCLSFEQLKDKIPYSALCWFQNEGQNVHRLLIKIDEEQGLELRCTLNEYKQRGFGGACLYSYFVKEQREVNFKIPKSEVICKECLFECMGTKEAKGSRSQDFQTLYEEVQDLEVRDATLELNREKDKEIWAKYVTALTKLVQAKKVEWKIKSVEYEPAATKGNAGPKPGSVTITIDEDYSKQEFEREVRDYFGNREIESFEIDEEKETATIIFDSNRKLADSEREELDALANGYRYEPVGGPMFLTSAKLSFLHDKHEEALFRQIAEEVKISYGLNLNLQAGGSFEIDEENLKHVQKVVSEKFGSVAIERENTQLSVSLKTELKPKLQEVKDVLDGLVKKGELKSNRSTLTQLNESQIAVYISAYIKPDAFKEIGLSHVKTVSRYGSDHPASPEIGVDGVYAEGTFYCKDNVGSKDESEQLLDEIKAAAGDYAIRQQPTRYVFECEASELGELRKTALRNFKTTTDSAGKNAFDISTSKLTIFANDELAYNAILKEIKRKYPSAEIEQKPLSKACKFVPKYDFETRRKQIVQEILNGLRNEDIAKVDYDENLQSIVCGTESEEVCGKFGETLNAVCKNYETELFPDFENSLSMTLYVFKKSETLEREYDEATRKNLQGQEFSVLTEKEREKFNDESKKFKPKTLGTLVKKAKTELRFKLSEAFEDELKNGPLTLEELRGRFVTPNFVGELANINRMVRAMEKLTNPSKSGFPANRGLADFIFDAREAREPAGGFEEMKQTILENLNEEKLNERQIEAVVKSLLAPDLSIIQGPPGTGKTTVIAEIIWQTLLQNPEAKILVSSQTNLAVDNALERLEAKKLVRPLRLGNEEKFEDFGKPYSYNRISEWATAEPGSEKESLNADNAVANWIKGIAEHCSANAEYSEVVKAWKHHLQTLDAIDKQTFAQAYIGHVNVFAATCSECGSGRFREAYNVYFQKDGSEPVFDTVIVDETSKATPPELALPLVVGEKIVLIGDHKQLPPMIDENDFMEALEKVGEKELVKDWSRKDFQTSQFEKLFLSAPSCIKTSLDTQYRMHEQIMDCVSQFYEGQKELPNGLICGIESEMDLPDFSVKASRYHGFTNEPLIDPSVHAIWVNVEGIEENVGTSHKNDAEVEAVKTVVTALTQAEGFKEYREFFGEDEEIGVITFYLPQMLALRDALYPRLGKMRNGWKNFEQNKFNNAFEIPFRINTVDRFQGMERNIIIVSTVRSNRRKFENGKITEKNQDLGFAKSPARINVAFSRARRLLIIVGNERHFSQREDYRNIIEKIRRNGKVIDIKQLRNVQP